MCAALVDMLIKACELLIESLAEEADNSMPHLCPAISIY